MDGSHPFIGSADSSLWIATTWLHTTPHCTKLLTTEMTRKQLSGNGRRLLQLYNNSPQIEPASPSFSKSLDLLSAAYRQILPQDPTAKEGDVRKESSLPCRQFFFHLHPFRMNLRTSYFRKPASVSEQAPPSSVRTSPPPVPSLVEGPSCHQGSFCCCVPWLDAGRWAPKDLALRGGQWLLNLLHIQTVNIQIQWFLRTKHKVFVHAVCLNPGPWPKILIPSMCGGDKGWGMFDLYQLILSFWDEPIYDRMLQSTFCK